MWYEYLVLNGIIIGFVVYIMYNYILENDIINKFKRRKRL